MPIKHPGDSLSYSPLMCIPVNCYGTNKKKESNKRFRYVDRLNHYEENGTLIIVELIIQFHNQRSRLSDLSYMPNGAQMNRFPRTHCDRYFWQIVLTAKFSNGETRKKNITNITYISKPEIDKKIK